VVASERERRDTELLCHACDRREDSVVRVSVIALMLVFIVAASAHAQGRPDTSKTTPATSTSPAVGGMFSKASIQSAVAKSIGVATPVPRANKSFWRSPWPYVIGVAAVVLIVAFAGGGSSSGMGIY
jgi:hypothetical protein